MTTKTSKKTEVVKVAIPPIEVPEPKLFQMWRKNDATGNSGKGRVADGIVFHNGQVIICWRSDVAGSNSKHGHSSLAIYPNYKAFELLHVAAHPENETEIVWAE